MDPDIQPRDDDALLDRLLAQNRAELIAIANTIVRDHDEAEDVVQATIGAVWRRLPTIAPDKLTRYLKHAVRQNAIKRKSRRRDLAMLDEAAASLALGDSDPIGSIDPFDLEEAIKTLPLSQQTVVRMKYYLGMTFRQIGISLSISTHTAASRARYALEKLRHLLTR